MDCLLIPVGVAYFGRELQPSRVKLDAAPHYHSVRRGPIHMRAPAARGVGRRIELAEIGTARITITMHDSRRPTDLGERPNAGKGNPVAGQQRKLPYVVGFA